MSSAKDNKSAYTLDKKSLVLSLETQDNFEESPITRKSLIRTEDHLQEQMKLNLEKRKRLESVRNPSKEENNSNMH